MVLNYSSKSDADLADLVPEIDRQDALRDVLVWAATKPKSYMHAQVVAEVITQDEFTRDVIVPYRDLFLVYDTT